MRSHAPQGSNKTSGRRLGALQLIFGVRFLSLFLYMFFFSVFSAGTMEWRLDFTP